MSPQKRKKGPCYFCGKQGGTTEHIPPDIFFLESKKQLITVSACHHHNNGFSTLDRETFVTYAVTASIWDEAARTKVDALLTKYPAMRTHIENHTVNTALGQVLNVDLARLKRFADRMFRGIYHHETGETYIGKTVSLFPSNVSTKTGWFNEEALAVAGHMSALLKSVPAKGHNPETFRYKFGRSESGRSSVLMFSLLKAIVIVASTIHTDSAGDVPQIPEL